MMVAIFNSFGAKHALATLDYSFDWTKWLGSDTIATASFTLTPVPGAAGDSDPTISPASPSFAAGIATVWVSGGVADSAYYLGCTITTVGGRTETVDPILTIVADTS